MLLKSIGVMAAAGVSIYHVGPYLLGHRTRGIALRGDASSRKVALTFDDGPDPRYTPRCLEILAAHGVKGAFFLIGRKVRQYPGLAREIAACGHDVGNHTWSHRRHWILSPEKARVEVREGARAITEVLGAPPRLFRPPWGQMNLFTFLEAVRLEERCVFWSLPARDYRRGLSPGWIVTRVARRLRGGAIVLLHDSGGPEGAPGVMVEALPGIIREAKRQGFQLVPVGEMLDG